MGRVALVILGMLLSISAIVGALFFAVKCYAIFGDSDRPTKPLESAPRQVQGPPPLPSDYSRLPETHPIQIALTPNPFLLGETDRYKLFSLELSWTDAYEYCQSEGLHLATINAEEDDRQLVELLQYHEDSLGNTVLAVMFCIGIASIQFVNPSMIVNMYEYPSDGGKISTKHGNQIYIFLALMSENANQRENSRYCWSAGVHFSNTNTINMSHLWTAGTLCNTSNTIHRCTKDQYCWLADDQSPKPITFNGWHLFLPDICEACIQYWSVNGLLAWDDTDCAAEHMFACEQVSSSYLDTEQPY